MGYLRRRIELGEQVQREQDAARGIPGRHEIHYAFSHISLPARVLDPGGLEFVEELMGKRGCKLLANVWNQAAGLKTSSLDKTNQLDFERVWSDITDRWKAIVITPPPALEPLEAYLIGIWRDYSPNDPLPEAADPSAANAPRGVRYFCLERGHTEGMTMVGEWLGFADRKNLGPGPEPVPEAMIYFMAKLHGIDPTFGNRSWAPSDTTQQSDAGPTITPSVTAEGVPTVRVTGDSALNLTDLEAAGAEVGYALFDSMKELAASQSGDNAAAHDGPVTPARSGGPAKARMEFWERDLPGLERSQKKYLVNRLEVATTRSERQVLRRRLKVLERRIAEIDDERHRELVVTQAWCPDCGGAFGNNHSLRSWRGAGSGRGGMRSVTAGYWEAISARGKQERSKERSVGPDDYHNKPGRRPRLINPVTGEHRWCKCPTGLDRASNGSITSGGAAAAAEREEMRRADDGGVGKQEPVTRARSGGPAKARRSRPVSVANELKKLAALRDDDVISEKEFQTLKQQLIEGA
jgi:hypothetical protein